MEGETIRSFIERFAREKAERELKGVPGDLTDSPGDQKGAEQMRGLEELQINRWWQRGEEVLRHAR